MKTKRILFAPVVMILMMLISAGSVTGSEAVRAGMSSKMPDPQGMSSKMPDLQVWMNTAKSFYDRGDFSQAAQLWEKAADQCLANHMPDMALDARIYLNSAYQSLGLHQRAASSLEQALPLVRKSRDPFRNTLFLNALADLHLSLGDSKSALHYAERAEELAAQTQNPHLLAAVLNTLGSIHAQERHYEDALAVYEEALELIDGEITHPSLFDLKSRILMNMTRTARQGRAGLIRQTLDEILAMPDVYPKAISLISLNLIIEDSSFPDEDSKSLRHEMLTTAKAIGEKIQNPRIISSAYGYLGELYADDNRHAEALALTRKAVFAAQQAYLPELLYLWQWQTGRIFEALGETEQSIRAYEAAIATLNPIRREIFREYRSPEDVFNKYVKPVYLGLADLFLKQADRAGDESLRTRWLKQAISVMERLKTAELQDFFQDECLTGDQKRARADEVMPEGTALLYPIAFPDRLVILLAADGEIRRFNVPVSSDELTRTAGGFREKLQFVRDDFLKDAQTLYNWLVRPAQDHLASAKIRTLIVAPDGVLRLIPFSALHNGQNFLVETYAIGTVPAISLTEHGAAEGGSREILLAGVSEGVQGFSPLPGVTHELSDIGAMMDTQAILENNAYTVDRMSDELKARPYGIIHMATHGVFGGSSKDSFLLTYEDKLTMNRLEQLIGMGKFKEQKLELLTLSACQTAVGDERAALGLAGVAVKAGAQTAMATLWYVSDLATSHVVKIFYKELKSPGVSKAEALQKAQQWMITESSEYGHPAFWAPFLLIGNWM